MDTPTLNLLATGFIAGLAVAFPPGPINAELARRCLANGFWAGFGLNIGACTGDALWALLVAFGVGALFQTPSLRLAMGVVSVALLLALAATFLKGAWRALQEPVDGVPAPSPFDSSRASFWLGLTMAVTSPWNVAFWLATIGRPEVTQAGPWALATVVVGVIAGAVSWGLVWCGSVVVLQRRIGTGANARRWAIGAKAATGVLMLAFAVVSARTLLVGG